MFGGPLVLTRPATSATILASGPSSRGWAGAIRGSPVSVGESSACSAATFAPCAGGRPTVGSCPVERGCDCDPRARGDEQRRARRIESRGLERHRGGGGVCVGEAGRQRRYPLGGHAEASCQCVVKPRDRRCSDE